MELLNNTSSPPINIVNHRQPFPSEQTEASALLANAGAMEPNNLSQTAANVAVASATDTTQATDNSVAVANDRNLALKLPLLSSSSSDSESEIPTNATVGSSVIGDSERASSPPPNCAICLGRCKNKCFTDSCMHQFCFKCLCEWSKVKPECPLCKQTFKSIIHNVKSIHQFEEYHVQPPTVQIAHPPFEMDFQEMRIFGVVHPGYNNGSIPSASGSGNRSVTLFGSGSGLRNQYVYRGELLDLYRQDNPGAIANNGTLSQLWRRYVYDRKLYAMPVADITGRFRESSARFYRDNPSQTHRLMPWINRDIVCLLRQSQHDVSTVLESINSALTLMNILSPAFRRRLQPYLGRKTAHFIHELNNFARSPYDMIGYDRAVQYSPQTNEGIVIEFTSSDESTDNEHTDVAIDTNRGSRSVRPANVSSTNAINLTIHNRLTSSTSANAASGQSGNAADIPDDIISLIMDLRGESDNNETISTGQATINSSIGQTGEVSDAVVSNVQPTVAESIELTSGSSDECEFILERKPPHLRTPEMVSLDSASDSDVVFVEETKPLNKTSFSSSEDECNDNKQKDLPNYHQHNTRNSVSSSTRSKITALVEAKKRNNTENLVKSEQQDSQMEIYNLGASTSAALRMSLQKRNNKSKRNEISRSKRLRREKYSLRNNEQKMPREHGKHLDSDSSHSSTSTNSSNLTASFSDTTSSSFSTSSSDEEYVANLSQRQRTTSTPRNCKSNKRRKTKKTKKRKPSHESTSHSKGKREVRNRKVSSSDDDNEENNGHMGKNFALAMAISERLQRQEKRNINSSSKQIPANSKNRIEDDDESEGENSWRFQAVNEPLRRQQQQQQQQRVKSSHRSKERKKHRKNLNTQEEEAKQQNDTYKKNEVNNKNTRKRTKTDKPSVTDSETSKPEKIKKFDYDESSSDESDNINLIQLKTKLTEKDQKKNVNVDTIPTHTEQNTETIDTLNELNVTNNTNNASELTTIGEETAAATLPTENLETYKTIPNSNNTPDTNETLNTLPSTSRKEIITTAATKVHVESMLKNDLHNSSDDSHGDEENDQIKVKHNNYDDNTTDHETLTHNDNQLNNTESHHHLGETSSSITNQNSINVGGSLQNHYHSDISEDDENHNDPDDDVDDVVDDDNDMSGNMSSKTNHNSSLNVFGDASSMSTTTTDTMLHDAAEQISSAAVNFYNSPQQEQQQPFNTAHFADENSSNTSSSSDTSLMSSSTSTSSSSSSSSSISSSFNTNVFMNFKNV